MNSDISLDALQLASEAGRPLLVPCAELTVYWRGSMFERADRLIGMYERVMGDLGPSFKYFETGSMAGARALRADSLQTVPFWLKSKPRRDIYMLRLESGERKNDPSDIALAFHADEDDDEPLGAMRVCLPASVLIERAGQFAERVAYYIGDLDFESGHAGFGVNWDPLGDDSLDAMAGMATIAERFHGVDCPDLDGTLIEMRKTRPAGIKRVSWLTLLGRELAGKVGGIEGARLNLPSSCLVRQLPGGLQIQAGLQPLPGHADGRDDTGLYKAVDRLLADPRFGEHPSLFEPAAPGTEDEAGLRATRSIREPLNPGRATAMVSDDGEDPEAADEPPAVPCSELVLLVALSRAGTEQDLQRLAQVVQEWTLRVRAAPSEWTPPAADHTPPPWHAGLVPASPLSFEVAVHGAYFRPRLLQDLVSALHAAREHDVPIVRISYR